VIIAEAKDYDGDRIVYELVPLEVTIQRKVWVLR